MITMTLKRDSNGNKVLQVKPDTGRAFSVQTLGNLPTAHSRLLHNGAANKVLVDKVALFVGVHADCAPDRKAAMCIIKLVWNELQRHVKQHGTARQKAMLNIE